VLGLEILSLARSSEGNAPFLSVARGYPFSICHAVGRQFSFGQFLVTAQAAMDFFSPPSFFLLKVTIVLSFSKRNQVAKIGVFLSFFFRPESVLCEFLDS